MNASRAAAESTCRAHCEGRYCGLRERHTGLHELPAGELLSTGGRRFGALYPAGWHRDDALAADRARYEGRARELSSMGTGRLRELRSGQLAAAGVRTVAGGPATMSKDELVTAALRREFPGEDRCDPQSCRWPEGPHSPYCVPGTAA